jgi:hypothetical protein
MDNILFKYENCNFSLRISRVMPLKKLFIRKPIASSGKNSMVYSPEIFSWRKNYQCIKCRFYEKFWFSNLTQILLIQTLNIFKGITLEILKEKLQFSYLKSFI